MNSWKDDKFVAAIKATGRKKLVMAALWTEVCLAFPALNALAAGYEIYAVEEALRLYTAGSSWFSGEDEKKGTLAVGQLADLAVLSADYLTIPEEDIRGIESVLTMVGGRVVYAAGEFGSLGPPPLPVSPAWSPVGSYGGYYKGIPAAGHLHQSSSCHAKQQIWLPNEGRLWGLGCDCFAF